MIENKRIKKAINFLISQGKVKSQKEVGEKLGITNRSYLSQLVNAENPSEDFINKFIEIFPQLNRDWLLQGNGDMLLHQDQPSDIPDPEEDDDSSFLVPLIPTDARAGILTGFSDGVDLRDCRKIPSPVPGADYAIQISGNSMEPDYRNGSYLFIKKINSRIFIPWGHDVVLDTENGAVFKKIFKGDDYPQTIIARSINPKYPDLDIDTSGIYAIYKVVGSSFINSTI